MALPSVAAGDQQLRVSWSAPGDGGSQIRSYDVRVSDDGGLSWLTLRAAWTGGALSHAVAGLVNGVSHRVQVRAVNAVGAGPWSESASGVPAAAPAEPLAPVLVAGDAQLVVSWSAPGDGGSQITSYDVRHSRDGESSWTEVAPAWTSGPLSYTVSPLVNGVSHRVQVRAVNAVGAGPWSESATAAPEARAALEGQGALIGQQGTPATVPVKPADPSLVVGDGELAVSWVAPADGGEAITSYDVQYSGDGGSSWTVVAPAWTSGALSYTVASLVNGTGYGVQVRAVNAVGAGPWSESAAATPRGAPAKPAPLVLAAGDKHLVVSWSAPADGGSEITSYDVRYKGDGESWTEVASAWTQGSLSYTIGPLVNGAGYGVQVRAVNAVGAGPWSESAAGVPGAPPELDAPVLVPGDGRMVVSWSAPDGGGLAVTSYDLRYRGDGAESWTEVASAWTQGPLSYTIGSLVNGAGYGVQVRAVNAVGAGPWSGSAAGVPGAPPAPASVLIPGEEQLEVSWSAPEGVSGILFYDLRYRGDGESSWTLVDPAWKHGPLSHTVSSLVNGSLYWVQVRAVNANGAGPWSPPVSGRPRDSGLGRVVAGDLVLRLDDGGVIVELSDRVSGRDHSLADRRAPLLSLLVEESAGFAGSRGAEAYFAPRGWSYAGEAAAAGESRRGLFTFHFDRGITADVRVVVKDAGYATFELVALQDGGLDVRVVVWGPLISDVVGSVGSFVGVVSSADFAVGMFGTNAKTVGGWPEEYLSLGYRSEMVGVPDPTGSYQWRRNGRNPYVVSAAVPTVFGSVVQAYTRDYSVERVFDPGEGGWVGSNVLRGVAALSGSVAHYGSLVPSVGCEGVPTGCSGSKVAVFGVARDRAAPAPGTALASSGREELSRQVLGRVGAVEVGEGMPHPIVEGAWNKISEASTYPYFILGDLSPSNMAGFAEMAEQLGFAALYKDAGWGLLDPSDLSISSVWGGSDSALRDTISQLAADHRIGFGTHTLSNWVRRTGPIAAADRANLAYRADARLARAVNAGATTIDLVPLEVTTAANLQAGFEPPPRGLSSAGHLLIDEEIIEYTEASLSGGVLRLSGLTRGASNSVAAGHAKDARARRLWAYGYGSSYNAGLGMMVNAVAPRMADIVDLGITDISLDGNEATTLSHDALGLSALLERFYFELSDNEDRNIDGAFLNSGSWHVYSRANWGELEDDITIAHQRYRWYNQATFAENYLPRAMGWWVISDDDEWRWAMAKAASFDAGFAYFGGSSAAGRYGEALRREIRGWHDARLSGAFDDHNRVMMRERDEYFTLDAVTRRGQVGSSWRLSDWDRFAGSVVRGTSRYIAAQMGGHPLVNVAFDAAASASSALATDTHAGRVRDGSTGVGNPFSHHWPQIDGTGEWIASPDDPEPWVQLDWDEPREVRRIVLFDRERIEDNAVTARLSFSDGTSVVVRGLPADGDAHVVDFAPKELSWVRYTINSHTGTPGLAELVALGPSERYAKLNLATGAAVDAANAGLVVDGVISGGADEAFTAAGRSVTLDLGLPHLIGGLGVWRDFDGGHTYKDVVFEIAGDDSFTDSVVVFNNDIDGSLGRGAGGDEAYAESSFGKQVFFAPVRGRYVRVWSNGSTGGGANRVSEIEVYGALDATSDTSGAPAASVSSSGGADAANLDAAIDYAAQDSAAAMADAGAGAQYLQIDLGAVRDVDSLMVLRDSGARRTYHDVVYQLSLDAAFTDPVTVHHSDHRGVHGLGLGEGTRSEYLETAAGRYVNFAPVRARYVRLYSNANNYDDRNRYSEVLVGARPRAVPDAPVLEDQYTFEGAAFAYTFDAATGPDRGAVTHGAKLADGTGLPAWLDFDAAARTFSGTPPADAATGDTPLEVSVTASRAGRATAATFALDIGAAGESTAIRLTASPRSVPEGSASAVEVTAVLDAEPRAADTAVTVTVAGDTASPQDFAPVQPFTVTIPAASRAGAAEFTLTPVDDDLDEDGETLTLTAATIASSDLLTGAPATVTIADNDTAGIVFSPQRLAVKVGFTGAYTLALTSQPTADVTVTPAAAGTVFEPAAVTFSADNWQSPQTVTVTTDAEADSEVTVTHTAAGGGYDTVTAALTVAVTENEILIAPAAITLAAGTGFVGFGPDKLIDGSGLSEPPTIENYESVTVGSELSGLWATGNLFSVGNYFDDTSSPNPQIVLELDGERELRALVVWGVTLAGMEASEFEVEFSTDGGSTYTGGAEVVQTSKLLLNQSGRLDFSRPRRADHVRITVTSNAAHSGHGGPWGSFVGMSELRLVTTVILPGTPAAPMLAGGDGKLFLSWSAPGDGGSAITSYDVRHSGDDGETWTEVDAAWTMGPLSSTIEGLDNAREYLVQVRAANANGEGPWSDSSQATPGPVPDKPDAPSLTAGDGTIVVSWSAPGAGGSAIASYDVRYSGDDGQTWTEVDAAWTMGPLSFTITSLDNGVPYLVQVRAVNGNGEGAWSDSSQATPSTVPDKPDAPSLAAGDTKLYVSWSAPGGGGSAIASYDLRYRGDSPPVWTEVDSAWTQGALSYTIGSLVNGTEYLVAVRAGNADGEGAGSGPVQATPKPAPGLGCALRRVGPRALTVGVPRPHRHQMLRAVHQRPDRVRQSPLRPRRVHLRPDRSAVAAVAHVIGHDRRAALT
ncbi:MAG: fibronectin type III domain-containing protein, partial [Acidimicrobiaceae bacterium]|nr:fibronectin type III domain-containing protein [Acidimicrobiaceae bacterium]